MRMLCAIIGRCIETTDATRCRVMTAIRWVMRGRVRAGVCGVRDPSAALRRVYLAPQGESCLAPTIRFGILYPHASHLSFIPHIHP